jgi:hypothetical protein
MTLHLYRIRSLKINDVISEDSTRIAYADFCAATSILCTENKFMVMSDACIALIGSVKIKPLIKPYVISKLSCVA